MLQADEVGFIKTVICFISYDPTSLDNPDLSTLHRLHNQASGLTDAIQMLAD